MAQLTLFIICDKIVVFLASSGTRRQYLVLKKLALIACVFPRKNLRQSEKIFPRILNSITKPN